MKKNKVMVLIADTEFQLVKMMNECKVDFFASQPIQKSDGKWVCFIYFNNVGKQ